MKYHNYTLYVWRMCESKNITLASFLDNFVLESHRYIDGLNP